MSPAFYDNKFPVFSLFTSLLLLLVIAYYLAGNKAQMYLNCTYILIEVCY